MKKTILLFASVLMLARVPYALHLNLGLAYGPRMMNDAQIKDVYGNGFVYSPYLDVGLGKGLFVGGGYEGGYSKSGTIGLYSDATTFKMSGIEGRLGFEKRIRSFVPYILVGFGSYSYRQTFSNPGLKNFEIDGRKWAVSFAGGVRVSVLRRAFLSGEIKYVPLKIKTSAGEVDLGGARFLLGIGYSI